MDMKQEKKFLRLKLKDIAKAIGRHEVVICNVINGKTVNPVIEAQIRAFFNAKRMDLGYNAEITKPIQNENTGANQS